MELHQQEDSNPNSVSVISDKFSPTKYWRVESFKTFQTFNVYSKKINKVVELKIVFPIFFSWRGLLSFRFCLEEMEQ